MFIYGVLRFIGGLDGHHKGGPAWDVGHVAFFAAMVLFAVLAVQLRNRAPARQRTLATVAAAAAVLGAGCFLWVIAGDLSEGFHDRWPLPDPLQIAGPLLFVLGTLTLLILRMRDRRLPVWSPVLFLVGYLAISVSLDLLPLGSLLVLAGLLPLARPAPGTAGAVGSTPVTPTGSPSPRA
jgi:hypothetical protein